MKNLILPGCSLLLLIAACTSLPKTTEYRSDRVVGRADDLSSRPGWVSETTSYEEKGDGVNIIGMVEVPGDSRAPAAFKASDAAARGYLANKIETQITKVVKSTETGFSMEDQQLQSLVKEVSRVSFHDIDIKNRYWEKVVRTSSGGQEELVLKAFSLITVPKQNLKNMILAAVKQSNRTPADDKVKIEHILETDWQSPGTSEQ